MKKSVINSILEEDTKRKGKIVSLICLLVIVFVISLAFALIYVDKSKVQYVTYGEDSNIDYNVYLKENGLSDYKLSNISKMTHIQILGEKEEQ